MLSKEEGHSLLGRVLLSTYQRRLSGFCSEHDTCCSQKVSLLVLLDMFQDRCPQELADPKTLNDQVSRGKGIAGVTTSQEGAAQLMC